MRGLIAALALLLGSAASAQSPHELPVILNARGGATPSAAIPIIFVGTGAIQGPGASAAFPSPVTVPLPAGVLAGDYMLAYLWQILSGSGAFGVPSGWTLLRSVQITNGNQANLYFKVAGGSEPASYTWTNGNFPAGGIRVYRNVSVSTPVDASAGQSFVAPNQNVSIPAMTNTAIASEVYVGFWDNDNQNFTMTLPAGFGNVAFTNNNINMYMADKLYLAAGSTVPVTTATISGGDYSDAIGVTLRPLP